MKFKFFILFFVLYSVTNLFAQECPSDCPSWLQAEGVTNCAFSDLVTTSQLVCCEECTANELFGNETDIDEQITTTSNIIQIDNNKTIFEDFSENAGGFSENWTVSDGQLKFYGELFSDITNIWNGGTNPGGIYPSIGHSNYFENFKVSVETSLKEHSLDAGGNFPYGISICNYKNENGSTYLVEFGIDSFGSYSIIQRKGEEYLQLDGYSIWDENTDSSYVLLPFPFNKYEEINNSNTLSILKNENILSFFINNYKVKELQIDDCKGGSIGLRGDSDVNVNFDNFSITNLSNSACTYQVSPTSQIHEATSTIESISVTAPSHCEWQATSSDINWLKVFLSHDAETQEVDNSGRPTIKVGNGKGSGDFMYILSDNESEMGRTGIITVEDKRVVITQKSKTGNFPSPILEKKIYQDGDRLNMSLPPLPTGYDQYVAIALPNKKIYLITDQSQLIPFTGSNFSKWTGGDTVIDITINENIQKGEYNLFLLRLPTGLDPSLHEEQWQLGVSTVNIANQSTVLKVTDAKTDVGAVIVSGENHVVTIAGDKDTAGNLTKVHDITLASSQNSNEWIGIHLDSSALPDSITYANGSIAKLTNYTDSSVDVTIYDNTGNVQKTITVPLDTSKLNMAKDLINKPIDPTDFSPTTSSSNLENEFYCIPDSTNEIQNTQIQPDWIKGAFLVLDAIVCATSVALTAADLGVTLPSTIWACSAFAGNFVEFGMESLGLKPPTILEELNTVFEELNMVNSSAQTLKSCFTLTKVNQALCGLGLLNVVMQNLLPSNNSSSNVNTECDFCTALEQVCKKHGGGFSGCYCQGMFSDMSGFANDCVAIGAKPSVVSLVGQCPGYHPGE